MDFSLLFHISFWCFILLVPHLLNDSSYFSMDVLCLSRLFQSFSVHFIFPKPANSFTLILGPISQCYSIRMRSVCLYSHAMSVCNFSLSLFLHVWFIIVFFFQSVSIYTKLYSKPCNVKIFLCFIDSQEIMK